MDVDHDVDGFSRLMEIKRKDTHPKFNSEFTLKNGGWKRVPFFLEGNFQGFLLLNFGLGGKFFFS